MFNKKIFIFTLLFIISSVGISFAEESKTINTIIAKIRKEQKLKENEKINPKKVNPKLLEELGDALMDQYMDDKKEHQRSHDQMGGHNSAKTKAMHKRMALDYLSENPAGYKILKDSTRDSDSLKKKKDNTEDSMLDKHNHSY